MVDVLLTHSNHLYYDRKQVRKMQPYPPLQTLLAAACLRRSSMTTWPPSAPVSSALQTEATAKER